MKKISIVVVLLMVVLFAGCGEKTQESKDAKSNLINKTEESKGFMGGIKDAMKNGVAMKCETSSDEGEWVVYTNGKNMRSEGLINGKKQNILKKDEVTYAWEDGSMTGEMMDMKCIQDFQKDLGIPDVEEAFDYSEDEISYDDLEEGEKTGKTKCTPSTGGDFSVPKNIKFIDQCKVMKEQMSGIREQMQKVKK